MKVITDPYSKNLVKSRMVALSPYQVYLEQVKGVSDSIRVTSQGYSYVPLQFGGLKGQREAVIADVVVDVMDFQSKGSAD